MAGKLDTLKHQFTGHADRSLGMTEAQPSGGVKPAPAISIPDHLVGLVRCKDAADIVIDRIVPDPNQPRTQFDGESLERLAESIRSQGILQPLRVRWSPADGRYVLISGERRLRAARLANLSAVPCIVHHGDPSATEILVLQLLENLQRENLSPLEQAQCYKKLMDALGWSANRLGKELAIPVSTVTRALELLDLPPAVRDLVDAGALAPSTACEVGRLDDPEDTIALATRAAEENLTKARVVEAVRAKKQAKAAAARAMRPEPGHADPPNARPGANVNPARSTAQLPTKAADARIVPEATGRVEIAIDQYTVSVAGVPDGAGPEMIVEILRRAVTKMEAALEEALERARAALPSDQ
jgi:ParB family chromosome partitioning protein